jgi:hypothetical protein
VEQLSKILQILKTARQLIDSGWCQHGYWKNSGGIACPEDLADSYCLLGALRTASRREVGERDWPYFYVQAADAFRAGQNISQLVDWNDLQERTKEEVLAELDSFILKLESEPKDAQR